MDKLHSQIEFINSDMLDLFDEQVIAVVDNTILDKYADLLYSWLPEERILAISTSEDVKNLASTEKIYRFFQERRINRSSIVLAIGGGITTDLGGFCAATYMRGCRLWLMPTTFVGMIDASIGGKTGLNFNGIKNNIGTFYPAEKILIYLDFLQSLPTAEINNGWSECVKAALLKPDILFDLMKESNQNISKTFIVEAINVKLHFVNGDIRDKSNRRFLNLGHTFGHVLEALTHYKISHGQAVAVGMRMAIGLSSKLKLLDDESRNRMEAFMDMFELPQSISVAIDTKQIKDILLMDKKAGFSDKNPVINAVIFSGFGNPIIKAFQIETIADFFTDYFDLI